MRRLLLSGHLKFQRSSHLPLSLLRFFHVQSAISVQTDALSQFPCSSDQWSVGYPLDEFISILKNPAKTLSVHSYVSSLHCVALKAGFNENVEVGTGILNLYSKCSALDHVLKMFDELSQRNILTWTILLSACVLRGEHELGLSLFKCMLVDGVLPNCFTLATAFKCCAKNSSLRVGKSIHGWIFRNDIENDIILQNSIINFYAKHDAFVYARKVFELMPERDAVSWNSIIGVHIQLGDMTAAMDLFRASPSKAVSSWNTFINGQMENKFDQTALELLHLMVKIGPLFDQYTFSIALALSAKLALLDLGKQIHCKLLRLGFENDAFVKNSMINMYSKCGEVETSLIIFSDRVQSPNLSQLSPSFITLIAGYVHKGFIEEALALFSRMLNEGAPADAFTLTSIAAACADAGIFQQGRQIHACIEKLGHGVDVFLASAVIDMYAKCGSLDDGRKVFDGIECTNIVFWTSMIASYALYGEGREAIDVFQMMLENRIMPNKISFVGILSACSHAGLVEEGYKYFKMMQKDHGIVPTIEHFNCMVDLLGRQGLLDEAKNFICEHNLRHHSLVWKTLISACRVHGDFEAAIWASEKLVEIEPHEAGSYVLLSNIYATKREWAKVSRLWSVMKSKGVKKQPGRSWIQLRGKVHSFVAGDKSHPESYMIYSYLDKLIGRLKELGYLTRTDLVLHDLEEEQREVILQHHSEKLAVAYGIISTPCGSPLRIMKNLRVCGDCHEAIKYVTQATGREIVLRDAYRFHHFKHGICTCRDYW
ncbi:Pentatricopeptide repeat-containing protein [Platanthera zijinensis]|uniref:Pentatricopeptide repeat-containing protein n=1 Tax=Platanthera zijinensis TaxID=2320716 RepID=A0AAP0AX13_9ASPA